VGALCGGVAFWYMLKVQEEQGYQQRDHGCTGVLGEQDKKKRNVVGVRGEGKVVFNRDIFQWIGSPGSIPWD
jgi:hypothetical protein